MHGCCKCAPAVQGCCRGAAEVLQRYRGTAEELQRCRGAAGVLWGAGVLQGAAVLHSARHSKGDPEGQAGAALPSQLEEEVAAAPLCCSAALSTWLVGDNGFLSHNWNQIHGKKKQTSQIYIEKCLISRFT